MIPREEVGDVHAQTAGIPQHERLDVVRPSFLPFGDDAGDDGVEEFCAAVLEMNPPYGVLRGTILENATECVIQAVIFAPYQHQVKRGRPATGMSVRPALNRISPETPKLRSTRGDSKPMVADEEEVVTAPQQSAEVSIRNDVLTENADKYLGWEKS